MRSAAGFLILCASAFSQSTPDKPFDPPSRILPRLPSAGAMKPRLCAIPLLNARRPGTSDKMPVNRPADKALEASRELKLQVPAPACDEKFFRNR